MTTQNYQRNPELETLLPKLANEERAQLKSNILDHRGVREPLTVWDETGDLVDGHHRDDIVTELRAEGHDIADPPIVRKSFGSLIEAQSYALRNQTGRRNTSKGELALIVLRNDKLIESIKAEAQKRMLAGKEVDPNSDSELGSKGDWMQVAAEIAGVGRSTIYDASLIRAEPEMEAELSRGRRTFSSAAKAIRRTRERIAQDAARTEAARDLPKFEHDEVLNQIMCIDVLNGLARIPSESVALGFTSPPYPILAEKVQYPEPAINYDGDYPKYLDWLDKVWAEMYRVLKPGGRLILNVDQVNVPEPREGREDLDWRTTVRRDLAGDTIRRVQALGFTFIDEILWWKEAYVGERPILGSFASPARPRIGRNWEPILIFAKGVRETLKGDKADIDITQDEFTYWTGGDWNISPDVAGRSVHPATFPLALPWRIIKMYTYRRDVVVDPFAGTGTTAAAAAALGRQYVGIEIVPRFADFARQRIPQVVTERAEWAEKFRPQRKEEKTATSRAQIKLASG